jgi:hypothetical protein
VLNRLEKLNLLQALKQVLEQVLVKQLLHPRHLQVAQVDLRAVPLVALQEHLRQALRADLLQERHPLWRLTETR